MIAQFKKIFKKILRELKILQADEVEVNSDDEMVRDHDHDFSRLSGLDFYDIYEHEKMLADDTRVDNYHEAISRYISSNDVVLDFGTGTGILAYFAAKQSPKKLYALDHSDFIEVAKKIADHNNINNVTFVKKNSKDFHPEEKLDVILHEQIGDELFDENMVENILDLKKRLLKKNGRILPAKFELFIEPFCNKKDHKVPYIWEKKVHGIDFSFLRNSGIIQKHKDDRYERMYTDTGAFDYFLCSPEPVVAVDLEEIDSVDEIPTSFDITRTVIKDGSIDGFFIYFKIIFDDELEFDSSPLSTHTSWGNMIFRSTMHDYSIGDRMKYNINLVELANPNSWNIVFKVPD